MPQDCGLGMGPGWDGLSDCKETFLSKLALEAKIEWGSE